MAAIIDVSAPFVSNRSPVCDRAGDPLCSPDARVRASIGLGNDCEPYVDPLIGLYAPIAPPGVQLPSCFALGIVRQDPALAPLLERVYTGTPQQQAVAIAEVERIALQRFALGAAREPPRVTYNATELAFFREQQRRIDAGLPIITAAQLAPLTVRPAVGPVVTTGVPMTSASWFGLNGSAPGFSFPTQSFAGFSLPQIGDAVVGALPTLTTLAAQYFLQQQQLKAQEDAAKRQLELLRLQLQAGQGAGNMLAMGGRVVVGPDGSISMGAGMGAGDLTCVPGVDPGCVGPSWMPGMPMLPGVGAPCGPRGSITVSPADAAGIYRQGCGGSVSTRARFFALRQDGTRDLFVKVGKVQSVSPRTLNRFARRWAKEAGLVASKRGSGRGRGRRRPR